MKPGKTEHANLRKLDLQCPPLPATMLRMVELLNAASDPHPGAIVEIVRRDPSVAAQLLHIVNASYYGIRQTVGDLDRAVAILGPHTASGIIMGMNILGMRNALDGRGADLFDVVVRHSVAVAWLSQHLLRINRPERGAPRRLSEQMAYSAGLLHDFGKLALIYSSQPSVDDYLSFCDSGTVSADEDHRDLERLFFGYDHVEAGEFVVRKLGLPEAIEAAVRFHHRPLAYKGPAEIASLVRSVAAANAAAHEFGFAESIGRAADLSLADELAVILGLDEEEAEALAVDLGRYREHLAEYVNRLASA